MMGSWAKSRLSREFKDSIHHYKLIWSYTIQAEQQIARYKSGTLNGAYSLDSDALTLLYSDSWVTFVIKLKPVI